MAFVLLGSPGFWPTLTMVKVNQLMVVITLCFLNIDGFFGKATFTKTPPGVQYVVQGTNAVFEWDYNQDNSGPLLLASWGVDGTGSYCMFKSGSGPITHVCLRYNSSGNATMILQNVLPNMTATYFCQLTFSPPNPAGLRSLARLSIARKPPTFIKFPSQINSGIEGGNDVTILAEVVGDYLPNVRWYQNGVLVNSSLYPVSSRGVGKNAQNELIVQSNLTIRSPTRTSGGTFMAKAVFGTYSPQANASLSVKIWYGPEDVSISSIKSGMGVGLGQSVTVSCSASSYPPARFSFYRNGTAILLNDSSGILTISSFTRNDTGNYSCMAANEVGNTTAKGVWFIFIENPPTTTTKPKPTTNSTPNEASTITPTKASNSTSGPGNRTSAASDSLPWWVWFTIALAVGVCIFVVIIVIICIRRRRSEKEPRESKVMRFSKGVDIDSYIQNTNYPPGYENAVRKKEKVQNGHAMDAGKEDVDAGKVNLGVRFESEADLIEHYRKGPEIDADFDDVDFKDHDPFEDDDVPVTDYDPFASDDKDPKAFDNELFDDDDVYKVNSESERDNEGNPDLYNQDFIQYEI